MRYSRFRLILKYANREYYFGIVALLWLVALMLSGLFIPLVLRELALTIIGQRTTAVVSGMAMAKSSAPKLIAANLLAHGGGRRRGPPPPRVNYAFTVMGRAYTGYYHVTKEEFARTQLGQRIPIVYLPFDPSINRQRFPWDSLPLFIIFGVGMTAFTLGVLALRKGIRHIREQVELVCNGTPALTMIEQVDLGQVKSGPYVRAVRYSYLTNVSGNQQLHHGTIDYVVTPNELHDGDLMLALYNPQQPHIHAIDRFDARQEDRKRLLNALPIR